MTLTEPTLSASAVLERMQYSIATEVSREVADGLRIAIDVNEAVAADLVRVTINLFGQRFKAQQHFWPRDWWQAFKSRWFTTGWLGPRLLRRWPIRYTSVVFDPKVIYPQIALPDEERSELMVPVVSEFTPPWRRP